MVFVVCNNQWAISVARGVQTAAQTLAQKAIAAGIIGEQVDGNDMIAVETRMQAALERARKHHEPTLLEMVCYRQHDHTTADDASRYETKSIRDAEWEKEPIARLKRYLESLAAWNAQEEQALEAHCAAEVDAAVAEYLAVEPQPLTSMFDYLYATLPDIYAEQRQMVAEKEAIAHG